MPSVKQTHDAQCPRNAHEKRTMPTKTAHEFLNNAHEILKNAHERIKGFNIEEKGLGFRMKGLGFRFRVQGAQVYARWECARSAWI